MADRLWNADDPFVTDDHDRVVGLACEPPHHAEMLAAGWEGGHNLCPLVAASPEHFSADVLVYSRQRPDGTTQTRTATLPDEPPFVYSVSGGGAQTAEE